MATPEWEAFKTKFNRKYKNPTEEAFLKRDNSRVAVLPPSKNVGAGANTVNWRTSGCVTGVKNQGQCGSCWAFSTTGSVEFACCSTRGNLVSLSEQNLIDCTYSYSNLGCDGGMMGSSFQYIIDHNGIDTVSPYTATSAPGDCKFSTVNVGCTISSFSYVPTGSEIELQSAVDGQVVSVAIDASHLSFQLYTCGVYNEILCSSTQLNHGVLVVGYGHLPGGDIWLVKNSWGISWGEAGYINMSRNKNNQCGIATEASYAIV
ncbi:hypothetical protein CHUAL_007162 [Chamberlinius hualienensis]